MEFLGRQQVAKSVPKSVMNILKSHRQKIFLFVLAQMIGIRLLGTGKHKIVDTNVLR